MGGGAPKHNKQLQAHSITLTSLVNVYDPPQNDTWEQHANIMGTCEPCELFIIICNLLVWKIIHL
jgi:hypothetical protein